MAKTKQLVASIHNHFNSDACRHPDHVWGEPEAGVCNCGADALNKRIDEFLKKYEVQRAGDGTGEAGGRE